MHGPYTLQLSALPNTPRSGGITNALIVLIYIMRQRISRAGRPSNQQFVMLKEYSSIKRFMKSCLPTKGLRTL